MPMNSTAGYVYILINPSLNGIVKIGKTQNNPDERAKELSSATGVPTPFFVAYSSYFKDRNAAEIFVHTLLANNRLAQNKEFFQVSVQKAIEAVREAESSLGVETAPAHNIELISNQLSTKPLAPWKPIFHSANAHYYGLEDIIEDKSEAFQLYLKSIKLGSISAYWKVGMMYLLGDGCREDIQKAKALFLNGTKAGVDLCWAGLADVFYREGHIENWGKCWKNYFSSQFFVDDRKFEEYIGSDFLMSRKEWCMCAYLSQAINKGWKVNQADLILQRSTEIFVFILWYRTNSGNSEAFGRVIEFVNKLIGEKKAVKPAPLLVSDEDLKGKSALEIFQIANNFYYVEAGENSVRTAIHLYEKAALAGFTLAYWKVGRTYSGGYNIVADKEKAIKFLNRGVQLGVDLCWSELAYIFAESKNYDKWNYCWKKYFESKTFLQNIVFDELINFDKFKSIREYQMFFYVQQATGNKWKMPFLPTVVKHRQQIANIILQQSHSVCIGEIPISEIIELMDMTDPDNDKNTKDYCQEVLANVPVY
jgi:TPR repeat protein